MRYYEEMIGELNGTVTYKGAGFIILSTGGVGYKVYVTAEAYQGVKEEKNLSLHTHLAVREDSMTLFGFRDRDELKLFEMLIAVSGIGPKSALAILSLTDAKTLSSAIAEGESSYLTKVSGIGRKNAEKIILELREKIGPIEKGANGSGFSADSEALEALETLGYGVREAREALRHVPREINEMSARLKEALKNLSKQ